MTDGEPIARLGESGWVACAAIRAALQRAGLPIPTPDYLRDTFSARVWSRARRHTDALRQHFAGARFAEQATFGVLLVPDPSRLDTRRAIEPRVRRGQGMRGGEDFVDPRLPDGALATVPGTPWTLVATITGTAGIFLGSDDDVRAPAASKAFRVLGQDTRTRMIRQLWGARVLQCGRELPDSTSADTWTFTLFCGEARVGGQSVSGTILHGQARQRLGKPGRRLSSARVCPALPI